MLPPRSRTWLAALTAVTLAAGVVAWRVVDTREDAPAVAHHGAGEVELPEFHARTVRAGDWADPATWSNGRPPGPADVAQVRHPVTFAEREADVAELWLSAPLRFARDVPTSLALAGSLVVHRGGLLEIGTKARPVAPDVTAALRFRVEDEQAMQGGFDFVREDTGLWVLSGGRVELHGAPVPETWTKLLAPAEAGDTAVLAGNPAQHWPRTGEAIVTATSASRTDETEAVRYTQAKSTKEGTLLTLAEPLRFAHEAGPDFSGEVGLLTHNVRVESLDPENRAHVFFYGGAGGGITYTQFDRMGPENQFSRYALHFHVMRDSSRGMEVRGSSFRGSGTFWLNIHGSNGMTIADNVGYRAKGSGFYMEHPAGIGNTWIHNLGASVAPSENLKHRNSVFWFLLGNTLVDNVGVGAYGGADSSGFFLPQQPREDPALDEPTVILHNEAHSNRKHGFASWMNLSPEFHVVDLLLWRNGHSGFHWGAYGTRFKAFRVRAFDNGRYDVEARVKGLSLVDSRLGGAPIGMYFSNPVVNTNPGNPSKIIRTVFTAHEAHDVAIDDVRTCERTTGRCPPMYLQFVDSVFNSPSPIRFGWQWDPQTRLWFQNVHAEDRTDLPSSFVLVREDQPRPSPQAVMDEAIGAWVSPERERIVNDLPPVVGMPEVRRAGDVLRFSVEARDDARVETIEFLLNGRAVGKEVRVADVPGYAFLTVRVTDVAGNVAYSPTVALAG